MLKLSYTSYHIADTNRNSTSFILFPRWFDCPGQGLSYRNCFSSLLCFYSLLPLCCKAQENFCSRHVRLAVCPIVCLAFVKGRLFSALPFWAAVRVCLAESPRLCAALLAWPLGAHMAMAPSFMTSLVCTLQLYTESVAQSLTEGCVDIRVNPLVLEKSLVTYL